MPEPDGLEVCRRLRAAGDRTPVLLLTARDAVPDRVRGLDAGADDYLVKPFALEELLARLRALLRRTRRRPSASCSATPTSSSTPAATRSHRGERPVELTRTEFLLLELLLRHPRQVLTRAQIFEHVWGYDFGPSSNSLEVYVGYLRRKLRRAAADPHGPRRRLRAARAMSFRRRIALSLRGRRRGRRRARLRAPPTRSSAARCAARSTTPAPARRRAPGRPPGQPGPARGA